MDGDDARYGRGLANTYLKIDLLISEALSDIFLGTVLKDGC